VRANSRPEEVIAGVLSPPPDGVRWLVDVFWIGGSFGTVAVLLLLAAVRRRLDVLRDLAVAAAGALAVSGILVLFLGAAGGRPETVRLEGYNLSFPVLPVAVAVGVATVGLPYLARGVQRVSRRSPSSPLGPAPASPKYSPLRPSAPAMTPW
jgi:hypothetical protein